MKEILIFAGTTEGRRLAEYLEKAGIRHRVSVATEYGELMLKEHPLRKVQQGRMTGQEIRQLLEKRRPVAVVDATHPYAELVTANIRQAVKGTDIPLLRLSREVEEGAEQERDGQKVRHFASNEACAEALKETEGNILLTTGSKELAVYGALEELRSRLYVRILPALEGMKLCMEQGITGKQIIAMQGPFTTEMNEATIYQYDISCLVTKASGKSGGYREKLEAAERAGIRTYVIDRPPEQEGKSFSEVCRILEELCRKEAEGKQMGSK